MVEDTAVAYHEAGHAVMTRWHNLELNEVTIEPGKGYLGRVSGPGPEGFAPWDEMTDEERRQTEALIMVNLAGYEAQVLCAGDIGSEPERSEGDLGEAGVLALCVSEGDIEEAEAFLEWLGCRVRSLLRQPLLRARVEAVAEALLGLRTLTGEEIRGITLASDRRLLESGQRSRSHPPPEGNEESGGGGR